MFIYWYIFPIFFVFMVGAVAWSVYRRRKMRELQQQQSPLVASPQGFAHTGGTTYTPTNNNNNGGGVYNYGNHQQQHQQQQYGGVVMGQPHPHQHHGGAPAAPGAPMYYGTGPEAYFPAAQQQYQQHPPASGNGAVNSYEQFPTVSPSQGQGQNIYGNIYAQPPRQ